MKFVDEFRSEKHIRLLAEKIRAEAVGRYTFMEVCGGHTAAIHRFGIPSLLPDSITLLSGPGCPVCVTPVSFIDMAIDLSKSKDIIITSFGDLIRVPGSLSSLETEKMRGADIRIVFSALDALEIASRNPEKRVVFIGIGFETTAPGTAASILEARKRNIYNFSVLCAHKIMPPALEAIINDGTEVNGFICPGHVATITGANDFRFLPEKYNIASVISGFEPADILMSVYMLVRQINNNNLTTEIEYTRAVTPEGNVKARRIMNEVFEETDAEWRGLGMIKNSGLGIKQELADYDALKIFEISYRQGLNEDNGSCLCGEVLRGRKKPTDCLMFSKVCTPENPVGACMVSSEGACNAYYRYWRNG